MITIISSPILYARHTYEARFERINKGSSWNVTITFEAVSSRWDENYNFSSGYSYGEQTASDGILATGFDLITDPNAGTNPIMALGKYKITAYENDQATAYFYMDWRTSGYGSSPDVQFKYDVGNNRFRDFDDTQTIDGTNQTVWDLRSDCDLVTTEFEPSTPQNASVASYNSMPKITWEKLITDDYVTGYDIYRSFTSPNVGFTKIATTTSLQYIDSDVHVGSGGYVHYRVKAVNGNRETGYSNVASITYDGLQKQKDKQLSAKDILFNYSLSQNYPNPFNPNTIFEYSIKNSGSVNLKIYTPIGKEVATLVNEYQSAGNYNLEFDASSLPSGIYIYQLMTDDFIDCKKFTSLK
ncbi:MAG: T9SS type A sorting domain-containing protein [Ignavibacteriales bacterium]|nr:T9SS type A sorting domain-containing protein [Ignavibacteriales bacterium]